MAKIMVFLNNLQYMEKSIFRWTQFYDMNKL